MKKYFFLMSLLFLLVATNSCKKPVAEVNQDYVGEWDALSDAYYTISISSNSKGVYQKLSGISTVTVSGKVKLKDDKLKIGVKTFDVDMHPTLVDGEYTMMLDGVTYYRY